jgi:hypothetical protein
MNKRLGFHYFQDTLHYLERDLSQVLPELKSLESAWLLLKSPHTVAIPEEFITGLIANGIKPIVHFDFQVNSNVKPEDIRILLTQYAKWGVKYVIFFDKPNTKKAWMPGTWSQGDLVERFLDRYLPFVRLAEQNGMTPVFPALEPGGDYWDLSFLRKAFQLAKQRRSLEFGANLHIAVSAQSFSHPIDWGNGGGMKWRMPRPYAKTEIGEQDHFGINTYQWYAQIAKNTLNCSPKIILLYMGAADLKKGKMDENLDYDRLVNLVIDDADLLVEDFTIDKNVIACLFWLMNTPKKRDRQDTTPTTLFETQEQTKPEWIEDLQAKVEETQRHTAEFNVAESLADWIHPIDHYLLLPSYEWGIPVNTLDKVRPIIAESRPTIGFSISEACNARKVTVWNENGAFSEQDIQTLREAGCNIDEHIVNSLSVSV